jgi:hypothetical protein
LTIDVRFFERDGEEALDDIRALPGLQLQKVAFWWLKRLRRDVNLGKPLGYQASTGDLTGLYKLYFDEEDEPWDPLWEPPSRPPGDPRPRYRIVFHFLPDEQHPELIEVISVGPKPPVYWKASDRYRVDED